MFGFSFFKNQPVRIKAKIKKYGILLSLLKGEENISWRDLESTDNCRIIFERIFQFQNGLPKIIDLPLFWPELRTDSMAWLPIDFYWELYERQIIDFTGIEGQELLERITGFIRLIRMEISSDDLPDFNNNKIELDCKKSIGQKGFQIDWVLKDSLGNSYKAEVDFSGIVVKWKDHFGLHYNLLSRNESILLSEIKNINAEIGNDSKVEQLKKWGIISSLIRQFEDVDAQWRILLKPYLENERPVWQEKVSADIEKLPGGAIKLTPFFEGEASVINNKITGSFPRDGVYSKTLGDGSHIRVIPAPECQESIKKIIKNPIIPASKVPEFLSESDLLLGSGFDYEQFSNRVREVGLFVYKSQPFIEGKKDGKEWWEWEYSLDLDPVFENQIDFNLAGFLDDQNQIDEIIDKVENAKKNDENFIFIEKEGEHNSSHNVYINVSPHDSFIEFLEAKKRSIEAKIDPSKRIKSPKLSLLIKDNIEDLEYSESENIDEIPNKFLVNVAPPLSLNDGYKLKDYQQQGFCWLMGMYSDKNRQGGLLADDMGLGKTFQIITFFAKLAENNLLRPTLVVVPKALIHNWKSEFEKFLDPDSLSLNIFYEKNLCIDSVKKSDVTITTYDTLRRKQLELGKIQFEVMVLDEAQHIKNFSTRIAYASKAMKAKVRLSCTGTPVENSLLDLWSIFDFFKPGLLSSMKSFKSNYLVPISKEGVTESERLKYVFDLKNKIRPFYIRRMKKDYLHELPPIEFKNYPIELSAHQKKIYKTLLMMRHEKGMILAVLQKLLMLCAHPFLVCETNDDPLEVCPKLQKTIEILNEICEKEEKVIIFVGFLKLQELLLNLIQAKYGIELLPPINGTVDAGSRLNVISRFESSKGFNVLIISPKAGGVGLNITGANHVICYTRPWNPAVENQAIDRVYRIGQQRKVFVHYPIASSMIENAPSVEDKLDKLLSIKKSLLFDFVRPTSDLSLSTDDFLDCIDSEAGLEIGLSQLQALDELILMLSYQEKEALAAILLERLGYEVKIGLKSQGLRFNLLAIKENTPFPLILCTVDDYMINSNLKFEPDVSAKKFSYGAVVMSKLKYGCPFSDWTIFDYTTLSGIYRNSGFVDFDEIVARDKVREAWWS